MSTKTLIAVVALARAEAGPALANWETAAKSVGAIVAETGADSVVIAAEENLEEHPVLLQAARFLKTWPQAKMSFGCTLATRVSRPSQTGEPAVLGLSDRSTARGRELAAAAKAEEMLLSNELGSMMVVSRSRLASVLERIRLKFDSGERDVYRLKHSAISGGAETARNVRLLPLDEGARAKLVERLGAVLVTQLGPIAPTMVKQVMVTCVSTDQLTEAIGKHLPTNLHESLAKLVDSEVRRLG